MTLPRRGEPARCVINVRVTATELSEVRRLARETRMTISGMVGEALAEYASDLGERGPLDRPRRLPANRPTPPASDCTTSR